VLGRILVAQLRLEHLRGGVVFGERIAILLLAELTGDAVEEGGGLADLAQDQFLARANACLPCPVHEPELLGLLLQKLGQTALTNQILERQRAPGLLPGLLEDPIQLAAELRLAHAAIASRNNMFRAEVRQNIHLGSAGDQQADGQQDQQADGPFRFGEGSEGGEHGRSWRISGKGAAWPIGCQRPARQDNGMIVGPRASAPRLLPAVGRLGLSKGAA